MSIIRRQRNQALDSLRNALSVTEDLQTEAPDLQELKNAAKLATQAAETLNRMVGMRMVIPEAKSAGNPSTAS